MHRSLGLGTWAPLDGRSSRLSLRGVFWNGGHCACRGPLTRRLCRACSQPSCSDLVFLLHDPVTVCSEGGRMAPGRQPPGVMDRAGARSRTFQTIPTFLGVIYRNLCTNDRVSQRSPSVGITLSLPTSRVVNERQRTSFIVSLRADCGKKNLCLRMRLSRDCVIRVGSAASVTLPCTPPSHMGKLSSPAR
jgi:hypothetical protein